MLDPKQIGRLLRQDWDSPTDLARELYSMFTGKQATVVEQPLEIQAQQGQAGLKLTRAKALPVSASSTSSSGRFSRGLELSPEVRKYIDAKKAPVSEVFKSGPPLSLIPSRPPLFSDNNLKPEVSQFDAASGQPVPQRKATAPNQPKGNSGFQVQSGLETPGRRIRDTPSQAASYAKPYKAPLFETQGEVSFKGISPVQFDRPPYIYNPDTDAYEPFTFDGSMTRIPLDTGGSDVKFGRVVSGGGGTSGAPGATYICDIMADPNPLSDPESVSVPVVVYNIDPAETIPAGEYIYPVVQDSDGVWWGKANVWI